MKKENEPFSHCDFCDDAIQKEEDAHFDGPYNFCSESCADEHEECN